ncbi:class I SAM-dependent methyltransferase [Sunxiuqinia elliptica]|uniref:C-methyltransferase-like protein n=1 Tax=Sunxiuqinia elliptica TaxID=655355 RepID=A0A4V3BYH4_9BACT|nr:class I SAM-dependent methyltransferase [Sunxiuqinia elliptica]TDO02659.1 C-methyltransferase-like protein [Sunxiuqinia elliptica]TDO58603.1 C-methyltransferase-like protein [Sunxiuqinia elliptica]
MKHLKCPSCSSSSLKDFFTIKNAPVQSLVTIKSYEEAMAIPRNDITLTFCNECGFIFNSTFDTSVDYYTKGYEDQQGFSPTFKVFITEVTNRFIDKYEVREKDVIEIGCGKGDFINLICELGNNRGVGIDPAYEEGRSTPQPNVRFIKEFYSSNHGDLEADVITCRHTMEHIHTTGDFVKTIRESVKGRDDVTVLIEVPSIVRILNIQAFWDIFNEHCSYFSPGSLARLFRMNQFEVLDAYLEYDSQYLFLEAKPVEQTSAKVHPLEETVDELRKSVDEFVVKINEQLSSWREQLTAMKETGKKVVVWGGGSKSVGFLTQFDDLKAIQHVVDINPHMQGNYIPGIGIQYIGPDQLKAVNPDTVIIMNGVYKEEIRKMLADRGMQPELICL